MFVHRLVGLSIIVWSLIVTVLWCGLTSTAWADAQTDRVQAAARGLLQKSYYKAPFPCSNLWAASGQDRHVLDLTPWAAASGLRRGDLPVALGTTRLTGTADSDNEIWALIPRGEHVDIRVERAGKEVSLRLPCRDDRQKWEAFVALNQAIAEGRWQDCINGVSRLVTVAGYAPAGFLYAAVSCRLEKAKSERQDVPEEYWRGLHAWATKVIEESHYRATGLAERRGGLLNVAEALERAGRKTLADDIKQQIAAFSQTPPGTGLARRARPLNKLALPSWFGQTGFC